MTDSRDLKVALLRAQRDRALRYDPEWGPDPEDRPLGYIVGAERRALSGLTFVEEFSALIAEKMFTSNAMMFDMMKRPLFDGGKRIVVPLTYATHDRDITS